MTRRVLSEMMPISFKCSVVINGSNDPSTLLSRNTLPIRRCSWGKIELYMLTLGRHPTVERSRC